MPANVEDIAKALRPCPVCGGEGYIVDHNDADFFVACTSVDCFCSVGEAYDNAAFPEHVFKSREDAIAAWNRRASDDALATARQEVEKVREAIVACDRFFREAMPKMNVAGSALDANAIDAWNMAEVHVARAICSLGVPANGGRL